MRVWPVVPCAQSHFPLIVAGILGRSCIDRPQADVLDFEIFLQAFGGALAAKAGFLYAAEWHDLVGEDAFVDANHSGVDLLGDAPGTAQVLAEDIGGEP